MGDEEMVNFSEEGPNLFVLRLKVHPMGWPVSSNGFEEQGLSYNELPTSPWYRCGVR